MAECTGWAPGRDLPHGICVHCGQDRFDHPKAAQSRASGKIAPIRATEYALADSPLAAHPSVISPASPKTPIPLVFCRKCNVGMVIGGDIVADDYACPQCGEAGPKSLTPSGVPHGEAAPKPKVQVTPTQIAFADGLSGVEARRPDDKVYMDWFAEGRQRRNEGARAADAEAGIVDGEHEPVPDATGEPNSEVL